MRIKIDIETDNEAFADGNKESELSRIIKRIADRIASGEDGGKCMDANGNCVGKWDVFK